MKIVWIITLICCFLLSWNFNRHVQNYFGRQKGFGGCYHCGDTWNRKGVEGHTINYNSEGWGMFPLCEKCYKKLSIPEIEKYVRQLASSWLRWTPDLNVEEIVKGAMETVRKEKP